jgi:murein DD-endopeptidase MepM/ murein hydrolase activator NlpD
MANGQRKYVFNPRTLIYEPHKPTLGQRLWQLFGYLSTSTLIATVMMIAAYHLYSSPKEILLQREVKQYQLQYDLLNQRVSELNQVVEDLQQRDDNIYRVIFEAEPMPDEVRRPGVGGVEKYRNLEGYDNTQLIKNTTQRIDQLTRRVYTLSKSFDEITQLASRKSDMLASVPAIQPVANKNLRRVASGFGFRIHPVYKTRAFHGGMDFTAPTGTSVYATGDGVVEEVRYSRRGYGNYILVNHSYGYKTRYAHLADAVVEPGQKVQRGEVIGKVGSTGLSTGPHLHYEVIHKDEAVNPINFFHNDLTPESYSELLKLANQNNQSLD